jgi:protein-S-isoprenylcysteine O-methyltransferase
MAGMTPWAVAAIWLAWLAFAGGSGYARSMPGDRIDGRATRVSVWVDLATVASMAGAVAVAVFVPSAAVPGNPWFTVGLGAALVVLGTALRHWAARALGPFFTRSILIREEHRTITSGPYRFVRHPGYLGVLVALIGLALTLGNWLSVALMVTGVVLAHVSRIQAEEAVLEAHLGQPYREFARTRKRLIPGVW